MEKLLILLAGVLIGGVSHALKLRYEKSIQAKNLASAFFGEIEAVLEVALKKENLVFLEQLKDDFSKSTFYPFFISFKKEYFCVYAGNSSNIGLLKSPSPELISKFYIYSSSILDELETISLYIKQDKGSKLMAKRMAEICELFNEAGCIGRRCCEQLNSDYKVRS